MTVFVKYFNLYLPPKLRVPIKSVIPSSESECMVYDMTLLTVEHKKFRIRHNFLYVKM